MQFQSTQVLLAERAFSSLEVSQSSQVGNKIKLEVNLTYPATRLNELFH